MVLENHCCSANSHAAREPFSRSQSQLWPSTTTPPQKSAVTCQRSPSLFLPCFLPFLFSSLPPLLPNVWPENSTSCPMCGLFPFSRLASLSQLNFCLPHVFPHSHPSAYLLRPQRNVAPIWHVACQRKANPSEACPRNSRLGVWIYCLNSADHSTRELSSCLRHQKSKITKIFIFINNFTHNGFLKYQNSHYGKN